jgi:hypothetical protein
MTTDDIIIYFALLILALYLAFKDYFVYRSPKLFRHGGVYLKLWGKQYRIFAAEDARLKKFHGDDEEDPK